MCIFFKVCFNVQGRVKIGAGVLLEGEVCILYIRNRDSYEERSERAALSPTMAYLAHVPSHVINEPSPRPVVIRDPLEQLTDTASLLANVLEMTFRIHCFNDTV